MQSHTERAVAALRTLRGQAMGCDQSDQSDQRVAPAAPGPVWDEPAACLLVGSLDAAFAAESWPALRSAFEAFRRGAAPTARDWRRSQGVVARATPSTAGIQERSPEINTYRELTDPDLDG